MINTKELMLGNLVEYKQQYGLIMKIDTSYVDILVDKYEHSEISYRDINPIELTDDMLKKLGVVSSTRKSVHDLQNARKFIHNYPLDITPLLKPKPILTTHDGVEVFDGDAIVWVCNIDGMYSDTKNKNVPAKFKAKSGVINNCMCVFSTESACQSYINQKWAELHPEPIFVTEDGVGIYEGMLYYNCDKSGFENNGEKAIVYKEIALKTKVLLRKNIRFSTEPLAQAYLNRTWAKAEADKLDAEYQSLLKATQCQNK
jgi:hypothetical protein